ARPGPNFDPLGPSGNRWQRPGFPGENFKPTEPPGANPFGRPLVPGTDFGRGGPPSNPSPAEKDRDQHQGLGAVPHIPHVSVPEFRAGPEAFKAVPTTQLPSGSSRWSGGGLLAAIGGAIASLFGALFGRKRDGDNP